jgi:uncharacterized membrane protein YjjP (DUF1212 family)
MLAVGASAADVTATVLRVAGAYGLQDCQVDVTFTSLLVSYDREGAVPLTAMRTVRVRGTDYSRLQGITDVARAAGAGELDVEEAHRRLDVVVSAPPTYRRTVRALGWVGMAASVAFLLGGGWLVGADRRADDRGGRAVDADAQPSRPAAVLPAGGRCGHRHRRRGPGGRRDVPVRPSLVVAAGIVVLLAGLSLVGSAQDAISGFPITAAARAFEVLTLTAGIVVGIAGVLDVAQRAQLPLDVAGSSTPVPYVVGLAASAGIAGFWALASHARPRAIWLAAAAGALSWATSWAAEDLGSGPAVAAGLAAVVVGFCGAVLTERLRIPPMLVPVCGIVPLLPGLAIYHGLFAIVVQQDLPGGVGGLVRAAAVGLALAAGVTLGEYLGRPFSGGHDRYDRRAHRRATLTDD